MNYFNIFCKKHLALLFFLLIAVTISAQKNLTSFYDKVDEFLAEHVENGLINYASIEQEPKTLKELVDYIAKVNLAGEDAKGKMAFYINAYNLTVIKSVITYYPVANVNNIKGFFDIQKHQIAREFMTLNDLEKKKLIVAYKDPRFHFVLVCGAKGCPPIITKAYRPEMLETQLEEQTKKAINDPVFTRVDRTEEKIQLSQIFSWYKRDFEIEGTLIDFINKFLRTPVSKNYRVDFYSYNWALNDSGNSLERNKDLLQKTSNIRTYTPSVLLKKGQWEAKLFNNLYTQRQFFNDKLMKLESGERSNFFSSIIQATYGISSKLNVGFDAYFRSTSNDISTSSPLSVLALKNNNQQRFGLTTFGPRVKYAPFNIDGFSLQSIILFPLGKDLEGDNRQTKPYIEYDGIQVFQQFLYDKSLGDFNLYGEATLYLKLDTKKKDMVPSSSFATPIKFFPSYFYGGRFSVYLMTEWAPTWGDGGISSFYVQSGIGHKFQITEHFEIEASYTNFWLGKNGGAGQTYNLGLRVIY